MGKQITYNLIFFISLYAIQIRANLSLKSSRWNYNGNIDRSEPLYNAEISGMKKNILRSRNSNINYMEKSPWKSNVHVEISFLEAE